MFLRGKDFIDRDRYLWTDMPDAAERLSSMRPRISSAVLELFVKQGYAIVPQATDPNAVDRFLDDLQHKMDDPQVPLVTTYWSAGEKHSVPARRELLGQPEAKVLDVHPHVPACHPLIFSPPILDFLRDAFDDEPVAFQTLYFEYGSSQGAHNDTAFVYVDPPNKMIASWIALEDVAPNTGELFYYPGSHKIGDQIFADGGKRFDPLDEHAHIYSQELTRMAHDSGLHRETFAPHKGDALFWAADLIHGGEKVAERFTRRSLVTHYCPLHASVPFAQKQRQSPRQLPCGGWIVSAT